ncbi:MAG TPA: hypothetical protein VK640_15070 [Actinomycetes bacterium]|nr:hypothetical protein [Actinomycetes bacterium]
MTPIGATSGRLLPVTGAITSVVWAGTQIVADLLFVGDPDPVEDPVGTQQALLDHQVAAMVTVLGSMYLAVLIVYFAAASKPALGSSAHSMVAVGGAVLLAVAIVAAGIEDFAIISAAHHADTAAIKTLGYAQSVGWPLLGAASGAFLLGTGLAARRERSMPRWLSAVTIVLGVLALLGPGAFVFWLVAPLWFGVVGITLDHRGEVVAHRPTGTVPASQRAR